MGNMPVVTYVPLRGRYQVLKRNGKHHQLLYGDQIRLLHELMKRLHFIFFIPEDFKNIDISVRKLVRSRHDEYDETLDGILTNHTAVGSIDLNVVESEQRSWLSETVECIQATSSMFKLIIVVPNALLPRSAVSRARCDVFERARRACWSCVGE
ncbi:Protein of unknown function [Gryllus bimaculatus]|nr:Protein of unknown function [Gryllus bimaculatus]